MKTQGGMYHVILNAPSEVVLPYFFNKRNTNHTCTVAHVNREMHIEIGTSSNFAFAFTVPIKETRDHQLQPLTKICTKYRKYIRKS